MGGSGAGPGSRSAALPALAVLVLLAAQGAPSPAQQQPQSTVYDVEVREVDSSQLGHILRNVPNQQVFVQGGPNQPLRPLRGPGQGQWGAPFAQGPGQWRPYQQPGSGAAPGPGGHTQAQFVAPSGQVYSLKNMNGQLVLVGPDGRWHPLNSTEQAGADQRPPSGHSNHHGFPVESPTNSAPGTGPGYPLPEPPQWLGGDERSPSYDSGPGTAGGGLKDIREAQDCALSETTYNRGKRACRSELLFEDNFHNFNYSRWKHDVLMPAEPDFEFVVYDIDPDNSYLMGNGLLAIKPTVLEDSFKPGFVMNGTLSLNGCTSPRQDLCTRTARTYRILPVIRSARITTKNAFSFRYGIVETRLLIPEGDWIYPAFTLEPTSTAYGNWYSAGQIRMPFALGNKWLSDRRAGPKVGLQVLRAGVALGLNPGEDITPTSMENTKRAEKGTNWRKKHFRVYRLKWTPDYLEFSLDGKPMGRIQPPQGGFVTLTTSPHSHPWKSGGKLAPFDQEFFLSLAVGVGGVNRFSDNGTNGEYGEHPKPWKNGSPKAMLDFWKARDHWLPTWLHPAMEVDYVKVWAL